MVVSNECISCIHVLFTWFYDLCIVYALSRQIYSFVWSKASGCPRIGRNKKVSQNPSARILSHFLGSCELPKKMSAWSDLVYPSPKASAFYQNIQRIFEIYKGKIFPSVNSIFSSQINLLSQIGFGGCIPEVQTSWKIPILAELHDEYNCMRKSMRMQFHQKLHAHAIFYACNYFKISVFQLVWNSGMQHSKPI